MRMSVTQIEELLNANFATAFEFLGGGSAVAGKAGGDDGRSAPMTRLMRKAAGIAETRTRKQVNDDVAWEQFTAFRAERRQRGATRRPTAKRLPTFKGFDVEAANPDLIPEPDPRKLTRGQQRLVFGKLETDGVGRRGLKVGQLQALQDERDETWPAEASALAEKALRLMAADGPVELGGDVDNRT